MKHLGKTATLVATSLSAIALALPASAGDLKVSSPVMRVITTARPAAGYFTLKNSGTRTRTLVGAASPACKKAMLHQSKMENGVIKMIHVAELAVPAGGSLVFAPGGYHVMCMHPAADIKSKKSVPVTLKFKNGEAVRADFTVTGAR